MNRPIETNLTEPAYWDRFWTSPFGISAGYVSHYYWLLSRVLRRYSQAGQSAIEIGCGGSVWLPTLAGRGVDSWGIDYSAAGVAKAERILTDWRARATVVRGDVFDRHALPDGRFELVYSLGLLEHFETSDHLLQRLWELTSAGGHVITSVPNLGGLWGRLQQRLDAAVFAAHRVYTPAELDRAHQRVGFVPVEPAAYFGGIYPLVVDYSPVLKPAPRVLQQAAMAAIWTCQQVFGWSMLAAPKRWRNPPALAGHILGVYRKPDSTSGLSAAPL